MRLYRLLAYPYKNIKPKMEPEKKLVTYTALALVADNNVDQIQSIREKYDPAFNRWPPHINISFPFVAPERFDELHKVLSEEFANFPQFQITVTQINSFPHGVIYLNPQTPNNQLQKIYDNVMSKFPQLVNKKHNGFTPHLTIANKVKKFQIEKLRDEFQNTWQEWKWQCKGLHFLQRDKDTPFRTQKFVSFQANE